MYFIAGFLVVLLVQSQGYRALAELVLGLYFLGVH